MQYVSLSDNEKLEEWTGYHLLLEYKKTDIENFFDAAAYLLSIDRDRSYFVREPLEKGLINENTSKENFRLNKILHLTNILYYTKEGKEFSTGNLCVLSHGAVIEEIYYKLDKSRDFCFLLEEKSNSYDSSTLKYSSEKGKMLWKIFNNLSQYRDQQLILFSQEDPAWIKAQKNKEKYLLIDEKLIRFYRKFYKHVLRELNYFD